MIKLGLRASANKLKNCVETAAAFNWREKAGCDVFILTKPSAAALVDADEREFGLHGPTVPLLKMVAKLNIFGRLQLFAWPTLMESEWKKRKANGGSHLSAICSRC